MLFTRCPDCRTTFRVTNEVLHKADGQVRCGRCSSIFSAYADLRERPEAPAAEQAADERTMQAARGSEERAAAAPASPARAEEPPGPDARDPAETDAALAEDSADAPPEPEPRAAAAASAARGEESGGPADVALASAGRGAVVATWSLAAVEEPPLEHAKLWRVGAGLAAFLLAAQLLHHFSADLAGRATIGPLLQGAYSLFGVSLAPRWNVAQYEIVDWIAAAEPNSLGQGNLVITARIHNRGSRAQPYPHVQLQLLDRWEAAVGRRVFRPQEYLASTVAADAMMQAGDTAQAQLVVIDPGPDAYGFELDVCVEARSRLDCAGDTIFR